MSNLYYLEEAAEKLKMKPDSLRFIARGFGMPKVFGSFRFNDAQLSFINEIKKKIDLIPLTLKCQNPYCLEHEKKRKLDIRKAVVETIFFCSPECKDDFYKSEIL